MTAFVRRFRELPSLSVMTEIEQIDIIDRTPTTPVIGVGYGTMMIVGEFEDGDFEMPTEVYGDNDELAKFGGFGYTYGSQVHQNPCARIHNAELWNGNGFLKGKYLRPRRKIICRVDTSVGDVRFSLAAAHRSSQAPFILPNGAQLSVTTDAAGPASSTALSAAVATITGGGFAASGYVGGEQIGIIIDGLAEAIVTFQVGDQTRAQVASRINSFLGYTAATDTGAALKIDGIQPGTGGQIVLRDITAGALASIGHAAGTWTGTGNVVDANAVTAAEAANLINSVAIAAINVIAVVDAETNQVIIYRSGNTSGTLQVDDVAGAMATDMGYTTGAAGVVIANVGAAFTLAAGRRVRNVGGDEWVTMRTISWPEGTATAPNDGSQDVEVRDAVDDGSGTGAAGGTVTTLVDYPSDRFVEVTNPGNLSVALTEPRIDAKYEDAFEATVDITKVSREVTVSLSARRSAAVIRAGRQNAIDASDEGSFGRIFVTRAPFGWSSSQAIADVALYRYDRVVYCWPGWEIQVSEIAEVGAAGGTGFSDDGVITIGADGPAAYLMSRLNPEENIGQDTGFLAFILGIEPVTEELNRQLYTALKAAGICAPRSNRSGTPVYQSEVTTDLTEGRKTIKRRKMADFIQDSLADLLLPYSKHLRTDARVAAIDAAIDNFLSQLKSANNPDFQRIEDYGVENITDQNPDLAAAGIDVRKVEVRMLASMDTFVIDTQIGEGQVITIETSAT